MEKEKELVRGCLSRTALPLVEDEDDNNSSQENEEDDDSRDITEDSEYITEDSEYIIEDSQKYQLKLGEETLTNFIVSKLFNTLFYQNIKILKYNKFR